MEESYSLDDTAVDLAELLRILRKRSKLILAITLTAIVLATGVAFTRPKVYQAEATLRIKQSKNMTDSLLSGSLLAVLPSNSSPSKQQITTYAEIMKSRTVLEEVIRLTRQGKKGNLSYEGLLGQITVIPVVDTDLLKIQVKAPDPQAAKRIANLVVDVFLKQISNLTRSEEAMAQDYIAERLQEAKQDLEQSEKLLQSYRSQNSTLASAGDAALIAQLAEIKKLMAENNIELASCQARLQNINQQLNQVLLVKRHEDVRHAEGRQPMDVQVIDRAVAPNSPIESNQKQYILVAAFLGLFAGTGIAFVLEYLAKSAVNRNIAQ